MSNQVPNNWFIDVLKLGVSNAFSNPDEDPLSWQGDALCAQTDQKRSSQKRAVQPAMQNESVLAARLSQNVSNTHWLMTSASEFGVDFLSASVAS